MSSYKTKQINVDVYHVGFEKAPAWLTENGRKLNTFMVPFCENQHGNYGHARHTIDLGGERYEDVFDGDYVVKNPDGMFTIYKSEEFEARYEPWDATWMDNLGDVLESAALCLEHWHEMAHHQPEYELLKLLIQNERELNEPLSFGALTQAATAGTPVWNKTLGLCSVYSVEPETMVLTLITGKGLLRCDYDRSRPFYSADIKLPLCSGWTRNAREYKDAPAAEQEGA